MTDNLPARQEVRTRFWDHNWKEVHPPTDFKYVSVDCAGVRWAGLVTSRGRLSDDESDLRTRIYEERADAVIAELNSDGVAPAASASRLQARLDNIGRWLHPGLWSGMDGRRGIFLRILAGEQIEPPESARSTDWKADDE